MGTIDFHGYLELLRQLSQTIAQLTQVEQEKAEAVLQDDLERLNQCMKQEQVLSLTLRGYDQKREAALAALQLTGVPLSGLATHAPAELQIETQQCVEALLAQYRLFQGVSEVTRDTLECNLHQINQILEGLDNGKNAGFQGNEPELPRPMRTDFRA